MPTRIFLEMFVKIGPCVCLHCPAIHDHFQWKRYRVIRDAGHATMNGMDMKGRL